MPEKSNLTSKQILEQSILYAIPLYLDEGETEATVLNKFKGNLVKTIQFLRERKFKGIQTEEKIKSKSKPAAAIKTKRAAKPKKNNTSELF